MTIEKPADFLSVSFTVTYSFSSQLPYFTLTTPLPSAPCSSLFLSFQTGHRVRTAKTKSMEKGVKLNNRMAENLSESSPAHGHLSIDLSPLGFRLG